MLRRAHEMCWAFLPGGGAKYLHGGQKAAVCVHSSPSHVVIDGACEISRGKFRGGRRGPFCAPRSTTQPKRLSTSNCVARVPKRALLPHSSSRGAGCEIRRCAPPDSVGPSGGDFVAWSRVRESNSRPHDYKSSALPTELTRRGLCVILCDIRCAGACRPVVRLTGGSKVRKWCFEGASTVFTGAVSGVWARRGR